LRHEEMAKAAVRQVGCAMENVQRNREGASASIAAVRSKLDRAATSQRVDRDDRDCGPPAASGPGRGVLLALEEPLA
jgi:hypothetical protein